MFLTSYTFSHLLIVSWVSMGVLLVRYFTISIEAYTSIKLRHSTTLLGKKVAEKLEDTLHNQYF